MPKWGSPGPKRRGCAVVCDVANALILGHKTDGTTFSVEQEPVGWTGDGCSPN